MTNSRSAVAVGDRGVARSSPILFWSARRPTPLWFWNARADKAPGGRSSVGDVRPSERPVDRRSQNPIINKIREWVHIVAAKFWHHIGTNAIVPLMCVAQFDQVSALTFVWRVVIWFMQIAARWTRPLTMSSNRVSFVSYQNRPANSKPPLLQSTGSPVYEDQLRRRNRSLNIPPVLSTSTPLTLSGLVSQLAELFTRIQLLSLWLWLFLGKKNTKFTLKGLDFYFKSFFQWKNVLSFIWTWSFSI